LLFNGIPPIVVAESERIAQLEARNTELLRALNESRAATTLANSSFETERAAHARTQASGEEGKRVLREELRIANSQLEAEREAHNRTQAEAAALRASATGIVNALTSREARDLMHRDASFADHYKSLRLAIAGDAGRALAERVPLWRELERAAIQWMRNGNDRPLLNAIEPLMAKKEEIIT
jgi:hypothetical protein